MRFVPGKTYRVTVDGASLELAQGQSYGSGCVAISFRKQPIPKGSTLTYVGTRNIGSDSFDEDVFVLNAGGARGAYRPQICGGAAWWTLPPTVSGGLQTRSGKRYSGEIGHLLDAIPTGEILSLSHAAAVAPRLSIADLRLCVRGVRSSPHLRAFVDDSDYLDYVSWRGDVENYEAGIARHVAADLRANGGEAPKSTYAGSKSYTAGLRTIYGDYATIAIARGVARIAGDKLVLVEREHDALAHA